MLRNIAERVRIPIARSAPIVVFNPMGWKRDDVVHAHLVLFGDVSPHDMEDYRKGMKLVDESGNAIPYYVQQYRENMSRALQMVFAARDVPPLGYRTYFVVPAERSETFQNVSEIKLDRENDRVDPRRPAGADMMENEFYRVSVDKVTGRVAVFDKQLNREIWRDVEMVGTEDHGSHYLRVEPVTGRLLVNRIREVKIKENNGVETVMRIAGDIGGTPTLQDLTLYRGFKRLDQSVVLAKSDLIDKLGVVVFSSIPLWAPTVRSLDRTLRLLSEPGGPSARGPRPSPSTRRSATLRPATQTDPGGSIALGLAERRLERLAIQRLDHQSLDRHRLAPARLSPVLGLAGPTR